MTTAKNNLREMMVEEVSLCGLGKNRGAKTVLFKAQPDNADTHTSGTKCQHGKMKEGDKCPNCGKTKKGRMMKSDVEMVLERSTAVLAKYNSNHDSRGRFSSGRSTSMRTKSPGTGGAWMQHGAGHHERDLGGGAKIAVNWYGQRGWAIRHTDRSGSSILARNDAGMPKTFKTKKEAVKYADQLVRGIHSFGPAPAAPKPVAGVRVKTAARKRIAGTRQQGGTGASGVPPLRDQFSGARRV